MHMQWKIRYRRLFGQDTLICISNFTQIVLTAMFTAEKPDTWTMNHWGTGTAWSGYQPRAMMGACRAWYELVSQGRAVPPKLKAYAENWLSWLVKFVPVVAIHLQNAMMRA